MKRLVSLCLLLACLCTFCVTGAAAEESEAIELRADNFLDYYELVLEDSVCKRDAKDKIKSVDAGSYVFVLKDEFRDRCEWEDDVTVGVKGKESYFRAKIDWETGEITPGRQADKDTAKALRKTLFHTELDTQVSGRGRIVVCKAILYVRNSSKIWMKGPVKSGTKSAKNPLYLGVWDVEITDVSGTLHLRPAP